jgi:hypothetical protein
MRSLHDLTAEYNHRELARLLEVRVRRDIASAVRAGSTCNREDLIRRMGLGRKRRSVAAAAVALVLASLRDRGIYLEAA